MYRPFEQLPGKKWRSGVWTEVKHPSPWRITADAQPLMMDAVFWEFSADTAKSALWPTIGLQLMSSFVATAEKFTSPYEFGVYDLLVLPESFPYGGELAFSRLRSAELTCRYGEQLSHVRDPHAGRGR